MLQGHRSTLANPVHVWIRKDLEVEQLAIQSPDRKILIVSVYIPQGTEALLEEIELIRALINTTRQRIWTRIDIVLAGDFNRHDQLWGGNDVTEQGEADPIIYLMAEVGLRSLLPRGTVTQEADSSSTIDLMLASQELADTTIRCGIYSVEHGSDHRAIETVFDIKPSERVVGQRLLFKNAPWPAIRDRVDRSLRNTPISNNVQRQTDQLMRAVTEASKP
jgi:hypothetical protein